MDVKEKLKWLKEILGSVENAIEELEDGAEFAVSGRHQDTTIHHIHDHLGWAEHLLGQEVKKLEKEN